MGPVLSKAAWRCSNCGRVLAAQGGKPDGGLWLKGRRHKVYPDRVLITCRCGRVSVLRLETAKVAE